MRNSEERVPEDAAAPVLGDEGNDVVSPMHQLDHEFMANSTDSVSAELISSNESAEKKDSVDSNKSSTQSSPERDKQSDKTGSMSGSDDGSDHDDLPPDTFIATRSELPSFNTTSAGTIAGRIVRDYRLIWRQDLPAVGEKYEHTTIITPTGLFQLNTEIQAFQCLLSNDELNALDVLDSSVFSDTIPIEDEALLYDALKSLDALNKLERAIYKKQGNAITGYTINEEVFLRIVEAFVNLIQCKKGEYPPAKIAYSKRLLDGINIEVVRDVIVSLRSMVQIYILSGLLTTAYLKYSDNEAEYYDIYSKNMPWFLISGLGIISLNLFFLRSGLFNKDSVLELINRFRLFKESMIAGIENWLNYGTMIFSTEVIIYGFLPILLLGVYLGRFTKDDSVINIAKLTALQTVWQATMHALTVGSFCSLGLLCPLNSIQFFDKNMDDPKVYEEFEAEVTEIRNVIVVVSFFAYCLRYPYSSNQSIFIGNYLCNVINAVSYVFLDNAALFAMLAMAMALMCGEHITTKDVGKASFYFTIQIVSVLFSFITTFPSIINLAKLSVEKNDFKDDIQERSEILQYPSYDLSSEDHGDYQPSIVELSSITRKHTQSNFKDRIRSFIWSTPPAAQNINKPINDSTLRFV